MSETPGTEAGPVTAAGRELELRGTTGLAHILAIEAEAKQQRDAELRAAVEVLPWQSLGHGRYVWKAAVLRLLSDHARADTPSREGGGG